MLSAAFLLLVSNGILALRLGDGVQGTFPKPLKDHEEREYVDRWILEEDTDARNVMIEHNLRLVAHIVKKYDNCGLLYDDLISVGTIGLIKAIDTFSIDKSKKISSYLSRCIENEILMYIRSNKKRKDTKWDNFWKKYKLHIGVLIVAYVIFPPIRGIMLLLILIMVIKYFWPDIKEALKRLK